MHNQKSQIFDDLKTLLLFDDIYSARMSHVIVESGRMYHKKYSHFLLNAVAISICLTALILSMDALPIILKLTAFCGSLMVGFIIEIMLNGDEYE